jgi:hypothetical protein
MPRPSSSPSPAEDGGGADDIVDLRSAVRSALASVADGRLLPPFPPLRGAIADAAAIDVYRAMRDVSHLLFEERAVRDALDLDPFEVMIGKGGGSGEDFDGDDATGGGGGGIPTGGCPPPPPPPPNAAAEEGAENDDDDDDDDEGPIEKKKNGEVIARVKVRATGRCPPLWGQTTSGIHAHAHALPRTH